MKKIFGVLMLFSFVVILPMAVLAQQKTNKDSGEKAELKIEELEKEGKWLDQELLDYSQKINKVIVDYKILSLNDIKYLPFQVSYSAHDGYIELSKHGYVYGELNNKIIGLKSKKMRAYTNGSSISKIEIELYQEIFNSETITLIKATDPSPMVAGTDDIVFYEKIDRKVIIDNKKLGEMSNTTVFANKNSMKHNFLIPMYSFYYNSILDIAETYVKKIKDSDKELIDFVNSEITK